MSIFRNTYRPLVGNEASNIDCIKRLADDLYIAIGNSHIGRADKGLRETEIAKQKLEECVMWAVKGITG